MAQIKALVVAGGGGMGGSQFGTYYQAGGGGGEVIYNAAFNVSSQDYTVTVGTGGATQTATLTAGSTGGNSVFSTITARGGKGGGDTGTWGKGGTSGNTTYSGGSPNGAGAGGGAGNAQNGVNATSGNVGGAGGNGTISTILDGTNIYYGGGGGGRAAVTSGANGLGNAIGGGGTGTPAGEYSDGTDGIVILRWLKSDLGICSITGTGNTITDATDDSNYSVAKFVVSGTISIREKLSLGEYLGAGSGTTKLLLHLNGNSSDSSGSNNHGTDTNITYSQANGKFGQGAGFAGNGGIRIDNMGGITNGSITFVTWFKRTGDGTLGSSHDTDFDAVLLHGYSAYFRAGFDGSNKKRLKIASKSATTWYYTNQPSDITDNVWNNAIFVHDGTNGKDSIYLNGQLVVETNTFTGNFTTYDNANYRNGIGGRYNNSTTPTSNFLNGKVDESFLENRAWTASEARKYFTNAKGRFHL